MRIPTFPRQSTADEADTERTPVIPRRDDGTSTTTTLPPVSETERARTISEPAAVPTAPAPRARASFIATLGLIFGVTGALLVLSGPLLGYGIGVAAVALLLSLAGIFTTRKRHVAGKTDALIGLALSIGALVIGVLALAGQLWWLGTDTNTVTDFRSWLDTQFEARF